MGNFSPLPFSLRAAAPILTWSISLFLSLVMFFRTKFNLIFKPLLLQLVIEFEINSKIYFMLPIPILNYCLSFHHSKFDLFPFKFEMLVALSYFIFIIFFLLFLSFPHIAYLSALSFPCHFRIRKDEESRGKIFLVWMDLWTSHSVFWLQEMSENFL